MAELAPPSRARLVLAFAAVYLIWGSTYLAIRYALDTLPPMLLAAARHCTAGVIVYSYARLRGGPKPTLAQWGNALLIGTLLLAIGNGGVVFAEQTVPSGIAAILVATVPFWIVLLEWTWKRGPRPSPQMILGVVLGLAGLGILTGVGSMKGHLDPVGLAILVFAALCWAVGSLHSRTANLPAGPLGVGMEMLCGGAVLLVGGSLTHEWSGLQLSAVSLRSALAVAYLVVFGSIAAFSAYIWLLKNVSAPKAATYAFVNPVVAVALGWALLDEALTPRMVIGAAVILLALAVITAAKARAPTVDTKRPLAPKSGTREAEG